MKLLFIGLLSLFNISAYGHPLDSDDLYKVGVGSEIEVLKDLNIPPYSKKVVLGSLLKNTQYDSEDKPRGQRKLVCEIVLNEPKPFDRVLRTGKVKINQTGQTVKHVRTDETDGWFRNGTSYGTWYTRVFQTIDSIVLDNGSIESINCFNSNGDTKSDLEAVTIGDFKKITAGLFEVKLSSPEEI